MREALEQHGNRIMTAMEGCCDAGSFLQLGDLVAELIDRACEFAENGHNVFTHLNERISNRRADD